MDDLMIALMNCEDRIKEIDSSFHPGTRAVVVWKSDLLVLMEHARQTLEAKVDRMVDEI